MDALPLDPVLRLIPSALGKLATAVNSLRTQLVAMEAAESARHGERMRVGEASTAAARAQAAAVRAALKAMGSREEPEEDTVEDARRVRNTLIVETQTEAIRGLRAGLAHAWGRVWEERAAKYRWAAYAAIGAILREAWAEYPILTALLRGIEAATTSTGSAP